MAVAPLDVLCCRITIGDPDPGNSMAIQNPVTLTEVQEVEIVETYKSSSELRPSAFQKGLFSVPPLSELPPSKARMPAE